jgi:LPXTG-motif cell wall-anchored protein
MRRALAAAAMVGTVTFLPAVAAAQSTPPTTIEVEESTVERDVTVTSLDVEEVDTDTDDDDSKAGLWGLLGLLGLVGLAGLAGRKRRDDTYTSPPTPSNTAPPKASGATGTKP